MRTLRLAPVLLLATACPSAGTDGVRRTPVPELVGAPVVTLEPSIERDGVRWARAGATLSVTLDIEASEGLDVDATTVTFTGVPLEHTGGGVWSHVLDGTEGDGIKDLGVVLVDGLGQQVRIAGTDEEPLFEVGFDFTPPFADCAVAPRPANGEQDVFLSVAPSETLQSAPAVTSSKVAVGTAIKEARRWRIPLAAPDNTDTVFTLEVTLTDEVGNEARGDDACLEADRSGEVIGVGPQLRGEIALAVAPSIDDDGVPRARAGAAITITIPTEKPLDPERSFVSLSGVALSSTDGETWTATLAPSSGDGRKELFATLVDEAGNTLELDRPDVTLVADFTAPSVASAILQRSPFFAPADHAATDTVYFTDADPFTGTPVSGSLTVVADEDIASAGVLQVSGPGSLGWGSPDVVGSRATYSLPTVVGSSEGTYRLAVTLTDAVGNTSATQTLDPTLVVDRTGPTTPPDVDTPGRTAVARAPWGTESTGGAARLEVTGTAGAVPEEAVVVIVDETGIRGQTRADAEGRFEQLRAAGDLASVAIAWLDDAGNASPSALVREGTWSATLGGKVPGRSFPNPHTLTETDLAGRGRPILPESLLSSAIGPGGAGVPTIAGASWQDISTSGDAPTPRNDHAMAFDPLRQQLVLFGGYGVSWSGDSWVWDGTGWTNVSPVGDAPTPRGGVAMAFDPVGQQLVLFGGYDGSYKGDTWAWDGATWTDVSPTGDAPPPRNGHAMAFDPVRQQLVLFGGFAGPWKGDTWVWDGATWTDVSPTGDVPTPRYGHAMAFDPVRQQLILFGGYAASDFGGSFRDDTWAWDGTTWTNISPTGDAPTPRNGHAMAFDPVRQQLILFGGYGGGSDRDDTWAWDGATWTDVSPTGDAPTPRSKHAMAFDPVRQQLVLFGGDDGPRLGDTWAWDGATWTDISHLGDAPTPRRSHAMARDPVRQQLILFGGTDRSKVGDTWAWDGTTWTDVSPDGDAPDPRRDHAMAFDPTRQQLILFGGAGTIGRDDTWAWNGTTWTDVSPTGDAPSRRYVHAIAFDPVLQQIVLFGGYDGSDLGDTWAWDGTSWTDVSPTGDAPSPRDGHAMGFDPVRQQLILFGGEGDAQNGDFWSWNGTAWTDVSPLGDAPTPRSNHAMVLDPVRQHVVLFGGDDGSRRGDTWTWDGATWTDVSPIGDAPSPRHSHAMAFDPVRQQIVLFGGNDGADRGDTWAWGAGPFARPTQASSWAWSSTDLPPDVATHLTVRWRAGGVGYPEGEDVTGATLQAWDTWRWIDLDDHTAGPETPTDLCWFVRQDDTIDSPTDCVVATDPSLLRRLFVGVSPELHFRVVPTAPNGTGILGDPDRQWAEVFSEYVEITVGYRLPAEE